MKQAIRFFNEAMGSGATPAQIQNNISKALKSAGFKVKKFQKMSSGHGGVWGGFYTVSDGMVLPFHVKKDGKVSYDAGPKDWIIGNIDYVDVMTRILKRVKKMPGYGQDIISNQANESVNEAIKPQGYSQLNTMVKHATIYLRDLSKALRKQDDDAVLREVHFLAAQFTTMEKMMKDKKWNAKYNESVSEARTINVEPNWEGVWRYFKYMAQTNPAVWKRMQRNLGSEWGKLEKMAQQKRWQSESVNEGKYHDYKNDESLTAKQKIGYSMREVRDKLTELDKLVKMNVRLKNEIGVDSTSYWKRTHGAMKKISERLVKLANKVGQLY